MTLRNPWLLTTGLTAAVVAVTAVLSVPVRAEAPPTGAADTAPVGVVAPAKRDRLLGAGWRSTDDRILTTAGDADGLHLMVADAADGYAWRTVATLAEPGFDTDRWVGNACLTGSGRRVVAVYAPRTFTNHAELSGRGAFTAVVDLQTGAVTRLPVTSSLAYFNPGCGPGESVALTQEGDEDLPRTRLLRVDAVRNSVGKPVELRGQVTSAVPVADGFVAARGNGVVEISAAGKSVERTTAANVPFGLTADAAGGVSYLEHIGAGMTARRLAGGRSTQLAEGRRGAFGLARGAAGRVFVTGAPTAVRPLPAEYARVDTDPRDDLSTRGRLAVQRTLTAPDVLPGEAPPVTGKAVRLSAKVTATGAIVPFAVAPGSPAPAPGPAALAGGSMNDPVDPEGSCAIPRNEVRTMAYQPRPRQVEWAVDYAIFNGLTATRPANFRNFGLPAYAPQGMFPGRDLYGGGHVAAQVMLGILTQETNLWQASQASSGEYGSPLIGNFYGRHYYDADTSDDWRINWDAADCGYGIGQVTDGMRKAGREKPDGIKRNPLHQRTIALDYAANIAASLQILQDKWNQTAESGLIVNNGDPTRIENWFFAAWAYNSGFHAFQGAGEPWGVGWGNNPINPRYDPERHPFLDVRNPSDVSDNVPVFSDAAHPQDWPYQEKVIGWAAMSIDTGDDGIGYRTAFWNGEPVQARLRRSAAKPDPRFFCDASNQCDPAARVQPNEPGMEGEKPGPCLHRNAAGQYDLKCWYHQAVVFKPDCQASCGYEGIRYDLPVNYAEPANGTHYPPSCSHSFPAGTVIVDDVAPGSVTPRCANATGGRGQLMLTFAGVAADEWTSKIDFHQLDSGYGGHHWFARARWGAAFRVTGEWRSPVEMNGMINVLAYVPPHGAGTTRAVYHIRSVDNRHRQVIVDQKYYSGKWVSLGRFRTAAGLTVTLDNTRSPANEATVAYDAMAFVPVPL